MGIMTAGDRATEEADYGQIGGETRRERMGKRERTRGRGGEREKAGEQLPRRFGRRRAWSRRSIFPDFSARGSREREKEKETCPLASQPRRARRIGTPAAAGPPLVVVIVAAVVAATSHLWNSTTEAECRTRVGLTCPRLDSLGRA